MLLTGACTLIKGGEPQSPSRDRKSNTFGPPQYLNHVEPLREQLTREPRPFPTLTINPEKKDIDSFVYSDFTIDGYKPHGKIAMEMAV